MQVCDWQGKKTKQNKIIAENLKNNNNLKKKKLMAVLFSSKKRTQVLLHSAALVSLTEGLQYKTRLVIDPKNKTKTHLRISEAWLSTIQFGGEKNQQKKKQKQRET